uniref:Thiolase C-terminal domain-containing protein n=1 Tax=Populus trichocarpa TaxID=3694 RepID=A0A3N7HU25_POPTR|eukprot:XP_024444104.1 3-ketoacyl-CoA thiolase 2, peroxisomal [Populus trichocarpa]
MNMWCSSYLFNHFLRLIHASSTVTGARCVATLLHEMKRRGMDCRFGVVSMCIGTGMGAAAVFESGDGCDELCNGGRKVESNDLLSRDSL